jgi:hypothetical protein
MGDSGLAGLGTHGVTPNKVLERKRQMSDSQARQPSHLSNRAI